MLEEFLTLPSKSGLEVNVREIHPPHPDTHLKHPTLFPADFFLVRQRKRVAKELRKDSLRDSFSISLKFMHTFMRW